MNRKQRNKELKKLRKPLFGKHTDYFKKSVEQGIDYFFEYNVAPELSWINNKRYSTDYWMYS